MKGIVSTLLILFHLVSTIGVEIKVHICGDSKTYSINGIGLANCDCDHEDEDHSDDCCSSKHTFLKSVKDFKYSDKVFIAKKLCVDFVQILNCFIEHSDNWFISEKVFLAGSNNSPPGNAPPYFLLFCSWLI